jgi:hypothetical protein
MDMRMVFNGGSWSMFTNQNNNKKIIGIVGKFIGEYVELLQNNIQFLEDAHEDPS